MKNHRRAILGMKYSEGIKVMVGTAKVLYWFAIGYFTKSSLMRLFFIFKSTFLKHSFIYSMGRRISSKNIQNTESHNLYKFV